MTERPSDSTITVRCPVCGTPRDAAIRRIRADGPGSVRGPFQGARVRCAGCVQTFGIDTA